MAYPSMNDYQDSIQNPRTAFIDPDLLSGIVTKTPLGLPRVASGGFALTYRIEHSVTKKKWAIRCFHKEIPDLQDRYRQISGFLNQNKYHFFVDFSYQLQGIKVNNIYYPIMKMDWVEGQLLNTYIENNLNNKAALTSLSQQLRDCVVELEKLCVAHGDLQHGNIIIYNHQLKLIDYDGMYVPGMKYNASNELGHMNYQHPVRNQYDFGPYIDRFSSIVIYVALEALQILPNLWSQFDNGENLLFRSIDFSKPDQSKLFLALDTVSSLQEHVSNLKKLCGTSLDQVPTLEEFISGNVNVTAVSSTGQKQGTPLRRQYEIYSASDPIPILKRAGNVIEVVGKVTDVKIFRTRIGLPCAFINFGDYKMKSFRIVVWAEGLRALKDKGIDVEELIQTWISVTQLVDTYKGAPQFILETTTKINILKDEQEAIQLLNDLTPVTASQNQRNNKAILDSIGTPDKPISKASTSKRTRNHVAPNQTINKTKNQMILDQISSSTVVKQQVNQKTSATTNVQRPIAIPKSTQTNQLNQPQDSNSIFSRIKKFFKNL